MRDVLYPVMMLLNAIVFVYLVGMTALYFVFTGDTSGFSTDPDLLVLVALVVGASASALVYGFRRPWK
jgi:hypothetical protein